MKRTQTNNRNIIEPDSRSPNNSLSRAGYEIPGYARELEKQIKQQWRQMKPKWFITIQWTPPASDFLIAVKHSKHFRNKLLTIVYKCRLDKLPSMSERCRMIWFHEKAQDMNGRITYHSHLHMSRLPDPYHSMNDIELLLTQKIKPGFRSLQHLFRIRNPSVVIKPWQYIYHSRYNLKDYYRFRHHQDADLTLDFENSDLIFTK